MLLFDAKHIDTLTYVNILFEYSNIILLKYRNYSWTNWTNTQYPIILKDLNEKQTHATVTYSKLRWSLDYRNSIERNID